MNMRVAIHPQQCCFLFIISFSFHFFDTTISFVSIVPVTTEQNTNIPSNLNAKCDVKCLETEQLDVNETATGRGTC